MTRKTILLDVDGVLADFIGPVCALAEWATKRKHKREDVTRFDFASCLRLSPDEKREVVKSLKEPGFWDSLPVFDGAQEGVARLREVADVVIVTSPWNSCPTWLYEREAWLKKHFDIAHGDVISTNRKHVVYGAMLIDDKTETLHAWRKVWGNGAVQWQTPHNRLDEWTGRSTRSWDQLVEWAR